MGRGDPDGGTSECEVPGDRLHVVVDAGRVVVEQQEVPDPGGLRERSGVLDGGVTEVRRARELSRRALGVVDEHVGGELHRDVVEDADTHVAVTEAMGGVVGVQRR